MLNFNNQVNHFIQSGRNLNAAVDKNGRTVLAHALKRGSTSAVTKLIRHGARINGRTISDYGLLVTPAEYGIMYGNVPTFQVLLQHGLKVNGSMLQLAIIYRKNDLAKLLLEHGVNVNHVEDHIGTSLHIAVQRNNLNGVKLLLQYGANANIVDGFGMTPLHWAVKESRLEIAKLLLQHDALPFIRNNQGKTAVNMVQKLFSNARQKEKYRQLYMQMTDRPALETLRALQQHVPRNLSLRILENAFPLRFKRKMHN